jgi:FixJ family two-component response regulator
MAVGAFGGVKSNLSECDGRQDVFTAVSSIQSASQSPMSNQVLIVDDEPNVRLNYRVTLESEGLDVWEASSAEKALEQFSHHPFNVAILDLRMPVMDGLDLLAEMRRRGLQTPTVVVTAYGDVAHAVRAMRLGAIDFLRKPLTPEALRSVVSEILTRHVPNKGGAPAIPTAIPDTFGAQLSEAKRLLNLQAFDQAWRHLSRALELNAQSPEALNLAGVFFEMQEDYERAKKLYGKAIKYGPYYEPAQQNMRRIFDLFHFGSSEEPLNFGEEI